MAHGLLRLEELLTTPERVAEIPLDQVPMLLAKLGGLQGALLARLVQAHSSLGRSEPQPENDHLLTAEEAASILGVTVRWLYRHARNLPFARRLSRKALRFSEVGLKRWMSAKRS